MISFFKKKESPQPVLHEGVIQRLRKESEIQKKEQILFVRFVQNKNGMGEVQVSFSDKLPSEKKLIRFIDKNTEMVLKNGEFQYEEGNIYFYPNVDLIWTSTPKKEIHKITSNYEFSKSKLYLESKDFSDFNPLLETCFKNENVNSVFMDKNICQLEIETLDEAKEIRISEVFLTFFSSFYTSPLKLPHHLQ
ncbi:hypothetical protein AB3N60_08980 [Leptospira sp. WS39.C2]